MVDIGLAHGTKGGEENYFCHILIPSKNHQVSRVFYEEVFGWTVKAQSGTDSLDILPPSGKGVSAELNSKVQSVVPSICAFDIEQKLQLIEKFGGRKLQAKTPVGKKAEQGYYALFQDPHGNVMCLYSRG